MMRVLWLSLVLAGCAGCSSVVDSCTGELRINLVPRSRAIVVGESFTPSMELSSCGGQRRLTDVVRWRLADPADTLVVRTDSITGRVTGLRPGSARVQVSGAVHGRLGEVEVIVR